MVEFQGAQLDRTFSASADPTRRALLARLEQRKGEGCGGRGHMHQPVHNDALHDGQGGERPGFSVCYRNGAGEIFHTGSTYAGARGQCPLRLNAIEGIDSRL